jgi:hypothetical protein
MGEWCKGSMVERRPAVRASCCEAPTSPRSAHCNGSTGQDGSNGRAVSAGRGAAARLHLRAAAWRGPQTLVTAGGCEKIFKLANARRRRPQNAKPQRPQPGQGSLKPPLGPVIPVNAAGLAAAQARCSRWLAAAGARHAGSGANADPAAPDAGLLIRRRAGFCRIPPRSAGRFHISARQYSVHFTCA